jgi:lipoyl(octanoyl) transferase
MTHEAIVFVRRGDEWLVVRRAPGHGGYWHSISGGVEPGESAAQAAARELQEETGLDAVLVDVGAPFSYLPEDWEPDPRGGGGDVNVECFLAEAPSGWEPELDWEHDDYRWCPLAEALELLFWPEPRAVLRALA